MAEVDYGSCVELACKMNSDKATYDAFNEAMSQGPDAFTAWLSKNGVPADLAKKIGHSSGAELYQTIGEAICKLFW